MSDPLDKREDPLSPDFQPKFALTQFSRRQKLESSATKSNSSQEIPSTSGINSPSTPLDGSQDFHEIPPENVQSSEAENKEPEFDSLQSFEKHLIENYPKFVEDIRAFSRRKWPGETGEEAVNPENQLSKGKQRLGQIKKLLDRKKQIISSKADGTLDETEVELAVEESSKPRQRKQPPKTLLDRIVNSDFDGPAALLTKALKEKLQIEVHIRGLNRLRNILKAYLVAFDKHWNLALRDVDETYFRSKNVAVFRDNMKPPEFTKHPSYPSLNEEESFSADSHWGIPPELRYKSVDNRSKRHIEVLKRHCDQLFVRGDNVILVRIL